MEDDFDFVAPEYVDQADVFKVTEFTFGVVSGPDCKPFAFNMRFEEDGVDAVDSSIKKVIDVAIPLDGMPRFLVEMIDALNLTMNMPVDVVDR